MSAEILRRAASLMRERAEEQAKPRHPYSDKRIPAVTTTAGWSDMVDGYLGGDMGVYCGSWHPDVAVAVADLLDALALDRELDPYLAKQFDEAAVTVARAYLGESA